MAITFNTRGNTTKSNSVGDGNIFVDSSVRNKLTDTGYALTPTGYTPEQIVNSPSTTMTNEKLVDGKSAPVVKDSSGNIYVVGDNQVVYHVSTNPVDPNTGTVKGNGDVIIKSTGGGTVVVPGGGVKPDGPVLPGGPVITPPIVVDPGPGKPPPGGAIGSGRIYTPFAVDDIVPNQQETVTRALWSGNVGNLVTFYTSSEQTNSSKRYYYEIFNKSSANDCGAEPQFSIAYGHYKGSGSADEGGQIMDTPSRAIYSQYKLLCLDKDKQFFTFGGTTTQQIYAINVNRARMREYLDEGNIELNIAQLSGSQFINGGGDPDSYTGSAVTLAGNGAVIRLVDDSSINPPTIMQSGEVYNIVSGSIEDGVYYDGDNTIIYGQIFRRQGIIVLNADKLDATGSFGTVTGREINGDNAFKLFTAMSGAALLEDGSGDFMGFQGRGAEKVKSTHYFVRIKNAEYNFSNNPSFVTGSEGDLAHPLMYNDPRTYITTVGLYNYSKELVAVAKVSEAIPKSFSLEGLIKVRLDY